MPTAHCRTCARSAPGRAGAVTVQRATSATARSARRVIDKGQPTYRAPKDGPIRDALSGQMAVRTGRGTDRAPNGGVLERKLRRMRLVRQRRVTAANSRAPSARVDDAATPVQRRGVLA